MTQREIFNQACKVTRTLLVTTAFVVLALPSFAHASFSFFGTPTATATGTSYYSVSVPIVSTTNESGVLVNYVLGEDTKAVSASFDSGQTKVVTLTGVLPSKKYDVSIVRLDSEANVHELGTVGSFTVTASNPSQPTVEYTNPNAPASKPATSQSTVPAGTTASVVTQRYNPVSATTAGAGSCKDGIDNDGDGKIDYYGTNTAEPDPSCITPDSPEVKDDVSSKLIPCTDKCSFSDVFKLANNVIAFILTTLLIPIFVILIMYTGWQYLSSRGNPKANARAKKLALHLVIGLVLILCAWLIVRTILSSLGYTDGLLFFN